MCYWGKNIVKPLLNRLYAPVLTVFLSLPLNNLPNLYNLDSHKIEDIIKWNKAWGSRYQYLSWIGQFDQICFPWTTFLVTSYILLGVEIRKAITEVQYPFLSIEERHWRPFLLHWALLTYLPMHKDNWVHLKVKTLL